MFSLHLQKERLHLGRLCPGLPATASWVLVSVWMLPLSLAVSPSHVCMRLLAHVHMWHREESKVGSPTLMGLSPWELPTMMVSPEPALHRLCFSSTSPPECTER